MKKIIKLMMMAFVATVMTIGFAACNSDDEDSTTNIYQAGFTGVSVSGSGEDATLGIMEEIEAAYTAVGIKESFTAASDSEVKSKAQKAEANLTNLDWKGHKGSMTYSIKNIKSNQTIYSKTFSNN